MPQINVPTSMDTNFLAGLASLGNTWGVLPIDEDTNSLVFLAEKLDAVEAALAAYPEAYLEHRKGLKLEELAAIRRTKEVAGPSGLVLDASTIMRLTAASVGLMLDTSRASLRWEISRGVFMELPRETVLGLAVAAVNKVQACFDTVYEKTLEIQAVEIVDDDLDAALADLEAIDLTTDWPE